MTFTNEGNYTSKQVLIDMYNNAVSSGNTEKTAALYSVLYNFTDEDYQNADNVMNSHRYPDKSLQFVKMNIDKKHCIPFDLLSADESYMIVWIVRRLSTYSNFVAFRVSDLVAEGIGGYSRPWCERKVKAVLASLRRSCALIPVDTSRSKTFGTVYMINTDIINAGGSDGNCREQVRFNNQMMNEIAPESEYEEDGEYMSPYDVVSMKLNGYPGRIRITCINSTKSDTPEEG